MTEGHDGPRLDALTPPEMAERAEAVGVAKASLPTSTTFVLAVLAGAFIALGGMFSQAVAAGGPGALPWGVWRLVVGTAFSLGLVLVVVGGAELFTGNVLLVMAWSSGRLRAGAVLRNWAVVDKAKLKAGEPYNAALRLKLDLTQLPKPFQVSAIGNKDWNITAEVKRWSFTPPVETQVK